MPFPPSRNPRRPGLAAVALLGGAVALAGCSTREVVDPLSGATAQRLVTRSLDRFVEDLLAQPEIAALADGTVHLDVHFLRGHPLLGYSERLIGTELELAHGITVAAADEPAAAEMDVFLNSLGTDNDDFGLSVPTLGLTPGTDSINVLALDM